MERKMHKTRINFQKMVINNLMIEPAAPNEAKT